jgi:CRISPR-associated protein Csm2
MGNYQSQNRSNYSNRPGGGNPEPQSEQPLIGTDVLQKIIVEGNAETMVKEADNLGGLLAQGKDDQLSTSQIRAIFGEVRRIQGQITIPEYSADAESVRKIKEKAFNRLHLLKPKMRYRAAKERKSGIKNLVRVLEPALNLVLESTLTKEEKEKRFEHFVEFFEAILAYHRAHGGK